MTVPVIIVATEEALAAVPRGARESVTRLRSLKMADDPAGGPPRFGERDSHGIDSRDGSRGGGGAPLMLVGVVKLAPSSLWTAHFRSYIWTGKFMHLGFHIYDLGFQSPDSEAAKPMVFATTLFLILLVVVLNMSAILIRERLRRKYATGAF
jgi:phosphate transport system permease protein